MGRRTTVGDLVRERRNRLGLSQRAAARSCGIPQSMLSRIESGETQPSVATLQRILDGLGAELHLELRSTAAGEPRREKERSRWLNRVVVGELMLDPDRVIAIARGNIERWRDVHAGRPPIQEALDRWSEILDDGVEAIVESLTGSSEEAEDLRQNSPFAGVLSPEQRERALASFRAHGDDGRSSVPAAAEAPRLLP
ncbi:helix-turn-helix transcriptional regulator [Nocardioides sp. GY 10113]|uniref:helix-turn-helix domain-containing protein n=1 Tax=Nocardioides sp. GY 10113 TaxID=2569761 RepID=UPI0010A91939|nr:helix-turn-helix transcriptional regulator [Nocardioides sp. GY 10113]TIC88247.1 helix-turn-helix transcriptional regulator [Nocardioides sp. GY 10113]